MRGTVSVDARIPELKAHASAVPEHA
jgi:hypothetical protein